MRYFLFVVITICGILSFGQVKIEGQVTDESQNAIPFATIQLIETNQGTYSGSNGEYSLEVPKDGVYHLSISSVGWKSKEVEVQVGANNNVIKVPIIRLIQDKKTLDEVVITGNLKPVYLKDSPVKTEVITSKFLREHTAPATLAESVFLVNGVQEVVGCGVCFTNSLSINGLPGPNTAILLDGMPIYGNLASVYGLNSIPNSVIDRIEIIKGPSSTLYGSEATAGVINVITKTPSSSDRFTAETKTTEHAETFTNASYTFKGDKVDWMIGGNHTNLNNFNDDNSDGFSDVVHLDQYGGFSKLSFKRRKKKRADIAFKYYYEDRRNGVEDYLSNREYRNLRGNDSIYGESIYTNRAEIVGTYDLPITPKVRFDYSLSYHKQNSFYGADSYNANQKILFGNLIYNKPIKNHDIIFGITNRYQYYDDNTFATTDSILDQNNPEKQYIPGVFVQDQWLIGNNWTLLNGFRLDHYNKHGLIFSPRVSVKKKLGDWTNFRLNTGTGFRIVNVFTEDHAALTGQTQVEFEDNLQPERSYNVTLNVNHVYNLGKSHGTIDVDFFYTYFSNRITPEYDDLNNRVLYENLDGFAETKGVSLTITHRSKSPFTFTLGGTLLNASEHNKNEEGVLEKSIIPFSTSWSVINTLNYRFEKQGLLLALTSKLIGPIELFEVAGRPSESESFFFQTFQLTKTFSKKFEVYAGIQNIWNYTQKYPPVYGTDAGFDLNISSGQDFDTDYNYGPLEGRELYFGLRLSIN